MQVGIFSVFLLVSSSLLFSTVVCDPNHHHHNHNNDFPWQSILSSLGIAVENQTGVISNIEQNGGAPLGNKEHYASESTMGILKSENMEGNETTLVVQNGTTILSDSLDKSLSLGYKIGFPILGIVIFFLFWYCVCKFCYVCVEACCCGCDEDLEKQGVVVMQSNTVETQQPQIILQQPIIHQQAYPPQGQPQWNQPPQGPPPQWTPHPMGQQQHYSPHSGYDNAGFDPSKAPPSYDKRRY
ncbi:unnamed protein product [Larinioides sclopetarius]|uniref:Uncharacterized protein n=1 Tax=Larinioides sclopetarius TaxID=280406 RepID=A0AAV2B098_9ARAC